MFARFRTTIRRLQVSLIATRRAAGKVRHENLASLLTHKCLKFLTPMLNFLKHLARCLMPHTHKFACPLRSST
jgi:hypothetical protein